MTDGPDTPAAAAPGATPPAPNPPPGPRPAGPWTRAILIASLVLNLVLLGAIAGAGISQRVAPDRRPPSDAGLGLLFDSLPDDEKRALRRAVVAEMRDRAPVRAELAADTGALLAAIRAEPFDRAAAEAALARQRARAAEFLEGGAARMLDRIAAMAPAARAAYADRLEQRIRRHRPGDAAD